MEVVSGTPFDLFVEERIAKHLGMQDTGFYVSAAQSSRVAELQVDPATGKRPGGTPVENLTKEKQIWISGGGLLSTAPDYVRFWQMLLNGENLIPCGSCRPKAVAVMDSDQLPPGTARIGGYEDLNPSPSLGQSFGLGFVVRTQTGGSPLPGSPGDFFGAGIYGFYFWVDPQEKLFAVMMVQMPFAQSGYYRRTLRELNVAITRDRHIMVSFSRSKRKFRFMNVTSCYDVRNFRMSTSSCFVRIWERMTNVEITLGDKEPASANSQGEIERRVRQGQVSWAGPLIVMTGRSFFMIVAQALVAVIYWLRGHPSAWNAAAPWWTVYATLVDMGCLALMVKFTRPEGIRLRDLIGRVRLRWGYDILLGIACFVVFVQLFSFPGLFASKLVFGSAHPAMYPGLLAARSLPFWAVIYSLSIFWLVWSPTEEMTYNGYVLPRILALTRRTWFAVPLVGFWWALQHSFIPFILDWKYVVWRFLFFLPGAVIITLIYLQIRRLSPLIMAHWPMDLMASIYTLKF